MFSIRTKSTLLTVCEIVIALSVVSVLASFAIRDFGNKTSDQILNLMCETGEKNLDAYFESVEQSVETVSGYAEADLAETEPGQLSEHLDRVKEIFEKMAGNTSGILTYYYRIDPEYSPDTKGFWYVNLDGEGFKEHEVTDITLYDTSDQSSLVWFTVPKKKGRSVWLPPYVTDNLDAYVLSYNVPIYKDGIFAGVIGIEIDYTTMTEEVDNITLYDNGYAFINDNNGNLIYHPHMDMVTISGDNKPTIPEGMLSSGRYFSYSFDGVEKRAVWRPLKNGMRFNVVVPVSEINENWHALIRRILLVSAVLILVCIILTMNFTRQITGPLQKLTEAARKMDAGNYDLEQLELDYDGNDEIGLLTRTVRLLVSNLGSHLDELNSLAYADALTSVRNKGAFDIFTGYIQEEINKQELSRTEEKNTEQKEDRLQADHNDNEQTSKSDGKDAVEFAVGIFDCDNLKTINDQYGHDKGDLYLKESCSLICHVFEHSPVFRIGGDEFAVILQNEDYHNREELKRIFKEKCTNLCADTDIPWEKVSISVGIAVYEPQNDMSVEDVTRRADKLMYKNKFSRAAG